MANNLCDRLIDYFNGDLDEQEKKAFEEHLLECNECREELEELRALTGDLPYASEPVEPPEGMKERILENVFVEEPQREKDMQPTLAKREKLTDRRERKPARKLNWWIPLLAAALLLSLLGNAYNVFNENKSVSPENSAPIVASALKRVQFQSTPTSAQKNIQASATLVRTDTGGVQVVVEANDLKQLQGSKVYQVWLIDGKKPYRAGTFIPNKKGSGAVSYTMNLPKNHTWKQIAISVEPTRNSQTPQGNIILASKL